MYDDEPVLLRVQCHGCEAFSVAKVLSRSYESHEDGGQYMFSFCECARCERALVCVQTRIGADDGAWDEPHRVWPETQSVDWIVPGTIGDSLDEAQRCLDNKCYVAAAIMCRRTLEAFCKHHQAKGRNLYEMIDALYKSKVIDERLHSWADALRDDGNLAVHDPEATFTRNDASDLVDFTRTFVEYAFVLAAKFEDFRKRREKRKPSKKVADLPPAVPPPPSVPPPSPNV